MISFVVLLADAAAAQRALTEDALDRMEETLQAREEDGALSRSKLAPLLVVSTAPAFEETRAWYPNAALKSLLDVFGAGSIRSCEACMAPRTYVDDGVLRQEVGALGIDDIVRLDSLARGSAPAARTAVWLDETTAGVTLRLVDVGTSRVLFAQNFDPRLREVARTEENTVLTRELERRARRDALSHIFIDAALYPSQHFSTDYLEQWGDDNRNLTGVSASFFDPVLGVGASYYRVIPEVWNLTLGGQMLVSLPTALGTVVSNDPNTELLDPLLTGVLVARLPIGSSNYGIYAMASTNLRVGLGISLMNITLFPVLP
jgi:hypothetical protein